jgi:hypothetical protein
MSKNLFLLSLATITLAATTFTNVASSRADNISISGSGSSSASLTPNNSSPRDGATCGPFYPSTPAPVGNVHILPYPYPANVGSIPISPFPYPNSPKSEPPATKPDCVDCFHISGDAK